MAVSGTFGIVASIGTIGFVGDVFAQHPPAATAFDGYPLAQQGRAGLALGIASVSSALGGIFSVVVLIVGAPLLSRVAYDFGPPEYFPPSWPRQPDPSCAASPWLSRCHRSPGHP